MLAGPMPKIKGIEQKFAPEDAIRPDGLSAQVESDISALLVDIKRLDGISGAMVLRFWEEHNILPVELAEIW